MRCVVSLCSGTDLEKYDKLESWDQLRSVLLQVRAWSRACQGWQRPANHEALGGTHPPRPAFA